MLSFQFMIFDIMTGLGLKNLYSLCTTSFCTSPVTKFMTKMHCPSVVRPNLLMLNRYAVFKSRSYHNDYKWEQKGQNKKSRVRNMMNRSIGYDFMLLIFGCNGHFSLGYWFYS